MTPYYDHAGIQIYHGDCREVSQDLGRFDLLLTDPPFGVGNFVQITGNKRGEKVLWNEKCPDDDLLISLAGMTDHQIVWGANYMNCFSGDMGAIVWIKNQPMPNFSKADIASCSFYKKVEIVTITWTNFVNSKETSHPCERPVALYLWCMEYAPNPQSILDPFMGSGSSLVAAKQLGKKAVGIEMEEKFCEAAAKRCDQEFLVMA